MWYPKQHRPVSQGTSYNPNFHFILILLCRWCRNCYKGKEVDKSCCKNGLPTWKGFGDIAEKSLWQDTISLWRVPAGKTCWADCKNLCGYLVPFLFWSFVVYFFVCLAWNIISDYFMLVLGSGWQLLWQYENVILSSLYMKQVVVVLCMNLESCRIYSILILAHYGYKIHRWVRKCLQWFILKFIELVVLLILHSGRSTSSIHDCEILLTLTGQL